MFNAATKTFVVQNVHPVGQAHIEIMQIEWENTWSHSRKAFFVVRCLLFEFLEFVMPGTSTRCIDVLITFAALSNPLYVAVTGTAS